MEPNFSRWHEVTPSSFVHERAALDYIRELLPDRHPFQAWSNFTFVSDQCQPCASAPSHRDSGRVPERA